MRNQNYAPIVRHIMTSTINQSEALGCVYACLAAEDVGTAVIELVGDISQADNADVLKIAEYALLKRPLNTGLAHYLDAAYEGPGGRLDALELRTYVRTMLDSHVQAELWQDPNLGLLGIINRRRSEIREDRHQIVSIEGVARKVSKAINSSTVTTYDAIVTNAAAIRQAGGMQGRSRDEFIAAVKADSSLPRAMTRGHLRQVKATNSAVKTLGQSYLDDVKPEWNEKALTADPTKGAKLTAPLDEWIDTEALLKPRPTHAERAEPHIGDIVLPDVTIGCLVSFEPILVARHYRHLVDLIERHGAWPAELRA